MKRPGVTAVVSTSLLTLVLGVACARPSATTVPAAPSAANPEEARPIAGEPSPLGYTLLINGQEAAPGSIVEADFSAPSELFLQFPVPVDPATALPLQRLLPEGTVLTWPDERTAHLLVWRYGSFAVDPTGVRSRDGKAEVKDVAPVQVRREQYPRATLYRVDDLLAGKTEPAARWRLPYRPTGFILAPDWTTALLFQSDPMSSGSAPSLLNLQTGENRPLPLKDGSGWFSAGGWLPDGRLFLQGQTLWLSADGGQTWTASGTGLFSWISRLSPQGSHLALWSPSGKVTIVDIRTGQKRELADPFRRPAQDGASTIAWSPDGQWLAGSDFDSEVTGSGARIRVVDPIGTRPSRTIEGVRLVTWLTDGKFLSWRSGSELVAIDPAGGEQFVLNRWATPSPDGRYLVYEDWDGQMPASYLVEVASGKRTQTRVSNLGQWTAQGDLLVLEGPFQ